MLTFDWGFIGRGYIQKRGSIKNDTVSDESNGKNFEKLKINFGKSHTVYHLKRLEFVPLVRSPKLILEQQG